MSPSGPSCWTEHYCRGYPSRRNDMSRSPCRRWHRPRCSTRSSIRSSSFVNCEKSSARWPSRCSLGSSLSSSTILKPATVTRQGVAQQPGAASARRKAVAVTSKRRRDSRPRGPAAARRSTPSPRTRARRSPSAPSPRPSQQTFNPTLAPFNPNQPPFSSTPSVFGNEVQDDLNDIVSPTARTKLIKSRNKFGSKPRVKSNELARFNNQRNRFREQVRSQNGSNRGRGQSLNEIRNGDSGFNRRTTKRPNRPQPPTPSNLRFISPTTQVKAGLTFTGDDLDTDQDSHKK